MLTRLHCLPGYTTNRNSYPYLLSPWPSLWHQAKVNTTVHPSCVLSNLLKTWNRCFLLYGTSSIFLKTSAAHVPTSKKLQLSISLTALHFGFLHVIVFLGSISSFSFSSLQSATISHTVTPTHRCHAARCSSFCNLSRQLCDMQTWTFPPQVGPLHFSIRMKLLRAKFSFPYFLKLYQYVGKIRLLQAVLKFLCAKTGRSAISDWIMNLLGL